MDRNSLLPKCPRCGNGINMEEWTTSIDIETGAAALVAGETVCLPGDCSACDIPLELFIERAGADEKSGVDVWVEDQREE